MLTLAAVGGIIIAFSWYLLLQSYSDLNAAKFSVINKIERDHLDLTLFRDEWKKLKKGPKKDRVKRWPRYAEQGAVERVVPLLFVAIYGVLAIYAVCS